MPQKRTAFGLPWIISEPTADHLCGQPCPWIRAATVTCESTFSTLPQPACGTLQNSVASSVTSCTVLRASIAFIEKL